MRCCTKVITLLEINEDWKSGLIEYLLFKIKIWKVTFCFSWRVGLLSKLTFKNYSSQKAWKISVFSEGKLVSNCLRGIWLKDGRAFYLKYFNFFHSNLINETSYPYKSLPFQQFFCHFFLKEARAQRLKLLITVGVIVFYLNQLCLDF